MESCASSTWLAGIGQAGICTIWLTRGRPVCALQIGVGGLQIPVVKRIVMPACLIGLKRFTSLFPLQACKPAGLCAHVCSHSMLRCNVIMHAAHCLMWQGFFELQQRRDLLRHRSPPKVSIGPLDTQLEDLPLHSLAWLEFFQVAFAAIHFWKPTLCFLCRGLLLLISPMFQAPNQGVTVQFLQGANQLPHEVASGSLLVIKQAGIVLGHNLDIVAHTVLINLLCCDGVPCQSPNTFHKNNGLSSACLLAFQESGASQCL